MIGKETLVILLVRRLNTMLHSLVIRCGSYGY